MNFEKLVVLLSIFIYIDDKIKQECLVFWTVRKCKRCVQVYLQEFVSLIFVRTVIFDRPLISVIIYSYAVEDAWMFFVFVSVCLGWKRIINCKLFIHNTFLYLCYCLALIKKHFLRIFKNAVEWVKFTLTANMYDPLPSRVRAMALDDAYSLFFLLKLYCIATILSRLA